MVRRRKKPDDDSTLGSRLRRMRIQKGWTQEDLAEMSDTTQAVIQKIENGKSLRPRKIEVIAEALGVDPAWLQFGSATVEGGLDSEALEVAKAWSRTREPERSRLRDAIQNAIQ